MMVELPESAALVATDPNRVYYLGAGYNPAGSRGSTFSNETLPQTGPRAPINSRHVDGLRQGLVRC